MSYRESRVGQQQTLRILSNESDSPAQQQARQNLDDASLGWTALDKPTKALWATYAATQFRKDVVTGRRFPLKGREAYMGLNSRFALISPGVPLPSSPPTSRFGGDTTAIALGQNGNPPTFTCVTANRAGVKTEIMGQRLASADRAPGKDDYVSMKFYAFTAAGQQLVKNVPPGVWSFAYRFVSVATGEASAVVVLGELTVGLSVVSGGLDELAEAA